jgi:hypothetical protein
MPLAPPAITKANKVPTDTLQSSTITPEKPVVIPAEVVRTRLFLVQKPVPSRAARETQAEQETQAAREVQAARKARAAREAQEAQQGARAAQEALPPNVIIPKPPSPDTKTLQQLKSTFQFYTHRYNENKALARSPIYSNDPEGAKRQADIAALYQMKVKFYREKYAEESAAVAGTLPDPSSGEGKRR